jgi:hypothetical protein
MTANQNPIFTLTPDIQWGSNDPAGSGAPNGPLLTAVAAMDGTGLPLLVFTAGANGSYLQRLIARPVGTNVVSVLRIFLNNGSSTGTQANNCLVGELNLPPTTANAAGGLQPSEFPLNYALPGGYKIYVTLGTTVAAGYRVCVIGGDY